MRIRFRLNTVFLLLTMICLVAGALAYRSPLQVLFSTKDHGEILGYKHGWPVAWFQIAANPNISTFREVNPAALLTDVVIGLLVPVLVVAIVRKLWRHYRKKILSVRLCSWKPNCA